MCRPSASVGSCRTLRGSTRPKANHSFWHTAFEKMEIISTSSTERFQVRADVWEARNSLWVYSPSIWDAQRNCSVFSFEDESWSVDTSVWLNETTVRLSLRKFPGNHRPAQLSVEIDCVALTAVVPISASTPFVDLEAALNHALTWA